MAFYNLITNEVKILIVYNILSQSYLIKLDNRFDSFYCMLILQSSNKKYFCITEYVVA